MSGSTLPRLFVAVWPPEHIAEELRALHRKHQRGVRFVAEENWHITLEFLGEVHPGEVVAALDRCRPPTATARLGPGVEVLGERAVVVPVHGIDALQRTVAEATAGLGSAPRPKRFTGHLTVARLKRGAHLPRVVGALVRAEFTVDEIALGAEPAASRRCPLRDRGDVADPRAGDVTVRPRRGPSDARAGSPIEPARDYWRQNSFPSGSSIVIQ